MSDAVNLLAKMTAGLSQTEKMELALMLQGNQKEDAKQPSTIEKVQPKSKTVITDDFKVIKNDLESNRKTPVKAGKNTFIPPEDDRDADDKSLNYLPKTKTTKRSPVEFVDVVCEKCRKTKSVSPVLATKYYICERCAR